MRILRDPQTRLVRSLFISDLHLGFQHSRVRELLDFLMSHEPENLYLVGDFIDGWSLQKRCYWQPECNLIIARLMDLACKGTQIRLAIGNHDNFLREGLMYCNTGHWVENCTAFIEDQSGRLQLAWLGDFAAEPDDEAGSPGVTSPCLARESVSVSA